MNYCLKLRTMNIRNRNYAKELNEILGQPDTAGKKLLLHSCCAPCSSYVLEYLSPFLAITVFYYNPNIAPADEYQRRKEEQKRLIGLMNETAAGTGRLPVQYIDGDYEPARYAEAVAGTEDSEEGGERCYRCFALRLKKTADKAKEMGADYFTTTLSVSPLKNATRLNEAGERAGQEAGVIFLPADFKKQDGYKRSLELSRDYGLYRQQYCGCIYSIPSGGKQKSRYDSNKDSPFTPI